MSYMTRARRINQVGLALAYGLLLHVACTVAITAWYGYWPMAGLALVVGLVLVLLIRRGHRSLRLINLVLRANRLSTHPCDH